MGTIKPLIDQSVYHHVAKESKVDFFFWRKLETIYEQSTIQNKVNLMERMKNLEERMLKQEC